MSGSNLCPPSINNTTRPTLSLFNGPIRSHVVWPSGSFGIQAVGFTGVISDSHFARHFGGILPLVCCKLLFRTESPLFAPNDGKPHSVSHFPSDRGPSGRSVSYWWLSAPTAPPLPLSCRGDRPVTREANFLVGDGSSALALVFRGCFDGEPLSLWCGV